MEFKMNDFILNQTETEIKNLSRKDAIEFVKRIVNQLDEHHGNSYNEPNGFEGVMLYFP
jgi:hypothetical protein